MLFVHSSGRMNKVKVEALQIITSYQLASFSSMSISTPIPQIQLFWNLTLKIQGQGHGCSQSSRSHSGFNINLPSLPEIQLFKTLTLKIQGQGHGQSSRPQNQSGILSTPIPVISIPFDHPIPEIWLFQHLTLKIQDQDHGWDQVQGLIVGPTSIQWALAFLRYGYFKISQWKSKVKGMGEVKGQGHTVGLASIRWTCFLFTSINPISYKIWPMECLTTRKIKMILLPWHADQRVEGVLCLVNKQTSFTTWHITVVVGTAAAWQRNRARNKKSPGCPGWLNDTILFTVGLINVTYDIMISPLKIIIMKYIYLQYSLKIKLFVICFDFSVRFSTRSS